MVCALPCVPTRRVRGAGLSGKLSPSAGLYTPGATWTVWMSLGSVAITASACVMVRQAAPGAVPGFASEPFTASTYQSAARAGMARTRAIEATRSASLWSDMRDLPDDPSRQMRSGVARRRGGRTPSKFAAGPAPSAWGLSRPRPRSCAVRRMGFLRGAVEIQPGPVTRSRRIPMVPFANIVCGTDLSDPSDEALRQALARCEGTGARLAAVKAAPLPYVGGGEVPITLLVDPEEFRKQTSAQIQAQLARAKPGAKADVEVLIDAASEAAAIVRCAESRGADLVVVGSRGSTGLRRMLLGSVAEAVVRHAHCSVLVARPSPAGRSVLAATDLSEASLRAISAAAAEADSRRARLTV